MGRLEVAMEPITIAKKRKQAFETRKKDIIKKARELTILCDVNVSMIICADDQEPEIFPPDLHKFTSLANLYRQDPEKIRYYILSDFFKEKTMKVEDELAIVKKKNMEARYPTWFDSLNNLSEVHLRELASGLEKKLNDVKDKVEPFENISKPQNQDNDSSYPSPTNVVNVESPSILSSSNPSSPDEDLDQFSFELEELLADESNEFSLQNNDSIYPIPTTVLNVESPLILSSSNPSSPDEDFDQFSFELEELLADESNDFRLQDNDSIYPSPTTVLNVGIPSILSSSNPSSPDEDLDQFSKELEELLSDESNEFSIQNKLPIQSSNRDSFMKLPTVDDHNHSYNHEYYSSSLPPTPSYISPEIPIPQQPQTQHNNSNDPNSKMKQQVGKSDIECLIDENFSLQPEIPHPTPTYPFQQELPKKPELPPFTDQYTESKQSWNLDSMMNLLMEDDDNDSCDHGNFSLQHPTPTYSFPREIQQPAPATTVYVID